MSNLPKKLKKISKTDEKSNFKKKIQKNLFLQNLPPFAKLRYFELQFLANILILMVLNNSTIKIFGFRRSCGVT